MNLIEGISFDDIETRNEKVLEQVKNLNSIEHERLGMEGQSKFGSNMKIVGYRDCDHLDILLSRKVGDTIAYDLKQDTKFYHFKNGQVKSNYDPTVCDNGYNGIGPYNKIDIYDGLSAPFVYNHYKHILNRVYNADKMDKYSSYIGCVVDESFLDYQNFFEWFKSEYYEVSTGEEMHIDKDILYKNNKIYSPTTCVIVPKTINDLFIKPSKNKGLPIGVSLDTGNGMYMAKCSINNRQQYLGEYPTIEEAFSVYKRCKEENIKAVANYYWNEVGCKDIPQFHKVYNAMMNYKVEITD